MDWLGQSRDAEVESVTTMRPADATNFLALWDPTTDRPFRGKMEIDWHDVQRLMRGEFPRLDPVVVRHAMGGQLEDIVWSTYGLPIIISDRVSQILEWKEFTGWTTYPVELYRRDGSLVPGYQVLAIVGRSGPIDWSQGHWEMKEYPAGWFPKWRGLAIAPESWDGSDFFVPADGKTGYQFVTEPVKVALEEAGIGTLQFVPLSEIEVDKPPE